MGDHSSGGRVSNKSFLIHRSESKVRRGVLRIWEKDLNLNIRVKRKDLETVFSSQGICSSIYKASTTWPNSFGILCLPGIYFSPASAAYDAESNAHYVFALGVARFLGCAQWIISVYETGGTYLYLLGSGFFWLPTVLLSEIIQTFILADFCYYYVKSVVNGQLLVSLPPV